ncbi:MAG: hypothetical protein G01um101417_315 [Parcubacteria group bacterium Gr01-1014_17]|nr:MAG: hypothetical protein G01um101417_315 [Parcubacteria group bacterium Gr01-1014_17]
MKESKIHPKVTELLQEVFGWFNEDEGERAGKYPEVYLVSLLENIKEELPEVSAMLYSAVDMARFGPDVKGFRFGPATERFQKILSVVQPNEKVPSHKMGKKSLKRRHLQKIAA